MTKFEFYQEVEILPNCLYAEYIGKKGVIMGIGEEDGVIYSYAVSLLDGESGLCFSPDCLKPTGKQFKREDFY
ncbi:immunity protein 31 of polymorphic toxin system [Frischella perrara]|uniref:Immunity protein 17 n=1 Tax=Frischella perrara TaxID=1267021 RepID=A0A0A7S549_FRIPE|nr:Imm31 family immunity protein [Frischella perrara]AJA45952.1 Immunity protein 17 [Frischella perrara]PWV58570.1 immunity protein 31 of polymorphic toxin system [Frischella perrara]